MKSNFQFWKRIRNLQYPNFLWITCPPQTSTSPYDYASHQFSFSGESWCTLPCGGRSKLFIIYLVSPTLPAHGSVPLLGAHTDEGLAVSQAHEAECCRRQVTMDFQYLKPSQDTDDFLGTDKLYTCTLNIRKGQIWSSYFYDDPLDLDFFFFFFVSNSTPSMFPTEPSVTVLACRSSVNALLCCDLVESATDSFCKLQSYITSK